MGDHPTITRYRKLRDEVKVLTDTYHNMKKITLTVESPDGVSHVFELDPIEYFDKVGDILNAEVKLARQEALEQAVDGE